MASNELQVPESAQEIVTNEVVEDGPRVIELTTPSGGRLHLIGTAHVSRESGDAVEQLIATLNPKAVVVELCPDRAGILTLQDRAPVPRLANGDSATSEAPANAAGESQSVVPTSASRSTSIVDVFAAWRSGDNARLMSILMSDSMQRVADKLDVVIGYEFRVAMRECRSRRIPLILGDRPLNVTLRRMWHALSLWERIKFVFSMLDFSEVDEATIKKLLSNNDFLDELMQELQAEFPSLYVPLVEERDKYLAVRLRQVTERHRLVLGVVGAGHCKGIERYWNDESINIDALAVLPPPNRFAKVAAVGSAVAGTAVLVGTAYMLGRLAFRLARRFV